MKVASIILFVGIFLLHSTNGKQLVATFSRNNIVGTVTFTDYRSDYQLATKVVFKLDESLREFDFVAELHKNIGTYDNGCRNTGDILYNFRRVTPNRSFVTTELQVTGPNSILGATVLFYDLKTKQTTCASILPVGKSTYAKVAISNSKIAGSFEFMQGRSGETLIFGEVSKSDGSTTKSLGHDWYISEEEQCEDASTVFDPFCPHSQSCSRNYQDKCAVGDLVGKHGSINVGVAGNERRQVIDTNLPLKKVISKTLVIKSNKNSNEVLGCGKIVLSGPLKVQARFTKKQNEGIYGTIDFQQQSPYHPTKLTVNLNGLDKRTNGYHVHQYPISDPANKCSAGSVGGHLNPFNVDIKTSPKPGQGSLEMYEIGDLSGKFGFLRGKSSVRGVWTDTNLPIYGANAIVGRSVVIHRDDATGSRLTCTSIEPKGAEQLTGTIDFTSNKDSVLEGSVIMRQFQQQNGVLTPTIIVVDLKYKEDNARQTKNHNWHVHISPLGDDMGSICSSALGHYNPAMVDVTNPVYGMQCSRQFPYRCEVGDSSSKVGTYDIGGGKRLFADVDTPLFGKFTSLGRSMVFHVENKGAARLSCNDIIPSSSVMGIKTSKELKFNLRSKKQLPTIRSSMARLFRVPEWRISYLRLAGSSDKHVSFQKVSFTLLQGRKHVGFSRRPKSYSY